MKKSQIILNHIYYFTSTYSLPNKMNVEIKIYYKSDTILTSKQIAAF